MTPKELKIFLDKKVNFYNRPSFIELDPISIPHQFSKKQDIEIAGLFAALFAWGQRTTIINKANELMNRMDQAPYDFICHHSEQDLKKLVGFKHRTFQDVDLLFLVDFLSRHYQKQDSLEDAFVMDQGQRIVDQNLNTLQYKRLRNFYDTVFAGDHLRRTEKHISTPAKKSACKRINMYLRWMVRKDKQGVDFGLWKKIKSNELIIPLDVHVCRVSEKLGLLENTKTNWEIAVNLTEQLRQFDAKDPVKYDFALFGIGVSEKKTS